ncbi:MAG TPA: DUF4268 domain-containing protein [Phycisphaerales bacterium]|nr:DUF4268 domain-containing protein [Phycisphaerales bacterium]
MPNPPPDATNGTLPPAQPTPFAVVPLGDFERVPIVNAWPGEATHFTPWLAQLDNIRRLGDAIDIDLEVQHQELPVGEFRADIVCVNTATGRKVLVENQYGRTDHGHLGQLLTYAAGVDAEAIVWIAEEFREAHRAAMDWLNRVTTDDINIFGVEIELWRIGTSNPAPRFNIIAKPNEWAETIKESSGALTETDALYLEYWTAFKELVASKKTQVRLPTPSGQTWMVIAVGKSYLYLSIAVTRTKKTGLVQLVLTGPHRLGRFKTLEAEREAIEAVLGSDLEWRELPDKKESHVRRCLDGLDIDRKDDWKRQHEVLWSHLDRFYRYFSQRVQTLGDGDGTSATNE